MQPIQFSSSRNKQPGLWENDFTVDFFFFIYINGVEHQQVQSVKRAFTPVFTHLYSKNYTRSQLCIHSNTTILNWNLYERNRILLVPIPQISNVAFHQLLNRCFLLCSRGIKKLWLLNGTIINCQVALLLSVNIV